MAWIEIFDILFINECGPVILLTGLFFVFAGKKFATWSICIIFSYVISNIKSKIATYST